MSSVSQHTLNRAHYARSIRRRQASSSIRLALWTLTSASATGTSLAIGVHGEQSRRSSSPTLRRSDSATCRTPSSCSAVPARFEIPVIGWADARFHSCGGVAGFLRWAASKLLLPSMLVVHFTCRTASRGRAKCSQARALTPPWSDLRFGTSACSSSARSQGGGGAAELRSIWPTPLVATTGLRSSHVRAASRWSTATL